MDNNTRSCTVEGAIYDYVTERDGKTPKGSPDRRSLADKIPDAFLADILRKSGINVLHGEAHNILKKLPPCDANKMENSLSSGHTVHQGVPSLEALKDHVKKYVLSPMQDESEISPEKTQDLPNNKPSSPSTHK